MKDVAEEKNFYQVETGAGPSLEVERLLGEIETEAKDALKHLVEGAFPPTEEARATVSLFLAVQWLRGRDQRDVINHEYDRFTKFFMQSMPTAQMRRSLREVTGKEPSDEEVDRMKRFFADENGYTVTPHQNESIKLMLKMAEGLGRVASSFAWRLIRFEEPCLLTSDAPVTMWTRPENRSEMMPSGGWAMSDEVLFVVDMKHALFLENKDRANEIVHAGTKAAKRLINARVVSHCYRRIFYHPDMNPLDGIPLP